MKPSPSASSSRLRPAVVRGALVLAAGWLFAAGCQAPDDLAAAEARKFTPAGMAVLEGTATYRTRQALPPTAELRVRLLDCGRPPRAGDTTPPREPRAIAADAIPTVKAPPYAFTLRYAESDIAPDRRYRVEAEVVLKDGTVILRSPADRFVLTNAALGPVDLLLGAVSSE